MAKISTYPIDSTPNLNDYVIGTDVNDANNTKNYTLGSILGAGGLLAATYVPYNGANANVDLGNYSLDLFDLSAINNVSAPYVTVSSILTLTGFSSSISLNGSSGSTGDLLQSNGPGATPSWVPGLTNYLPYTGATQDVDLGSQNLTVNANIFMPGGISTLGIVGILTAITVNSSDYTVTNSLDFSSPAELRIATNPGTLGESLLSGGAGASPLWGNPITYQPKAQFYNTTASITFTANTMAALPITTTDSFTSDISAVTNGTDITRILFAKTGIYRFSYTCNVTAGASGANHNIRFWLRKNGTGTSVTGNISYTTQRLRTFDNSYSESFTNSLFVDITAGDYLELMAMVDDTALSLSTASPGVGYPSTPAVAININQV